LDISRVKSAEPGLDGVQQGAGDIEVEYRIELPDTRRARHVDLCQVVAYDIDAGEDHATLFQYRAYLGADPAVALAEFESLADGAHDQIAAKIISGGNPCERVRNRVAVNQQYSFVACTDFGNENLAMFRK